MDKFLSFPPFYTAQPHKETHDKQVDLWSALILQHCKQHRLFTLPPQQAHPWRNDSINRSIQPQLHSAVLHKMQSERVVEQIDQTRFACWWATADQFGEELLATAATNGAVMTAYELFYEQGAPFEGMPELMYMKVLQRLVDKGRAALVRQSASAQELGIKFLLA